MPPLVPCAACARHVFADETRCPFCAARRVAFVALLAAGCHGPAGGPADSASTPTATAPAAAPPPVTTPVSAPPSATASAAPSPTASAAPSPTASAPPPARANVAPAPIADAGFNELMRGVALYGAPPGENSARGPVVRPRVTLRSSAGPDAGASAFQHAVPRMRVCYTRALDADPSLKGTATFDVVVDGSVDPATVAVVGNGTGVSDALLRCGEAVLRRAFADATGGPPNGKSRAVFVFATDE